MTQPYDVIVVGGGPAGATATFTLGKAGLRVLVLEKATLPRYKACGGGLSLGLLQQFPFSFDPVIESHVKSISYVLGHRWVQFPLPRGAMRMVMRDRFDAHILAHAQAEVRQGQAVRRVLEHSEGVSVELASGERLEARFVIGADGASSTVARELGLRRRKVLAAAIEAEAPVTAPVFERFADAPVFIFGRIRLGYLWIFPKSDHLSVGIGAIWPGPGELQRTLKEVMTEYGISLEGVPLHGHPLPVYLRGERIATGKSLLVGDAAGLVDPLTGEGIRYAVRSGRIAAECILAGRPEEYSRRVRREIGVSHTFGLILAHFFYRFPGACFALGVRNPFATSAFVDLLSDRADYPEVIARLFASLPFFLGAEAAASLARLLGGERARERVRSSVFGTST